MMQTKDVKVFRLGENPRWYRTRGACITGYARWRARKEFNKPEHRDDPETGFFSDGTKREELEKRIARLLRYLARHS